MVENKFSIKKIKDVDSEIKVDSTKVVDSIKELFNIKSNKVKTTISIPENKEVGEEKTEECVLNENESFWNELFIKINKEIEEEKANE